MAKLSEYNIDDLTGRVEDGGDSSGQKAMPILLAKSMLDLQKSVVNVSNNLCFAITGLKSEIRKSRKSNDNYSRSMKWLTGALVFVGVVQIFVAIFKK